LDATKHWHVITPLENYNARTTFLGCRLRLVFIVKKNRMFMTLTTIAVLTVLYALAWHDQPAREPQEQPRKQPDKNLATSNTQLLR